MIQPVAVSFDEVVEELPAGEYKATISDCEQKTSQAGNAYLRWQLNVVDHAEPKYNGKAVWTSTPTTGKGAFRLAQLIRAATKERPSGTTFDPNALMGKTVAITVVAGHDRDGNLSGYPEVKSIRAI